MSHSENTQFPTLSDDVRAALKQWHGNASTPSPLRYLYIFRQTMRERRRHGFESERDVTNQLLAKAMERFHATDDADVELLHYRYLDKWQIQRLAKHYNVAQSTMYAMQTSAVERLTDALREMELLAGMEQKYALLERLEPSGYVNLIGVSGLVSQLKEILTDDDAPSLISLEGIGGIGKTSLADFTVRELIDQGFVDEVGWVTARQTRLNLGGALKDVAQPNLSANMLVERLVTQLMPDVVTTHCSVEELVGLLSSRLKAIPHLIVIDNLETLIDVESLLPTLQTLVNPSKFILTSRESLHSDATIFPLQLTELNQSDALALIRQEAIQSNLPLLAACPDEELLPIIDIVGGNPLALRLVTGQTHLYSLESVLQDLKSAEGKSIENMYAFIYRRAWERLEPTTKQIFLLMPLAKPGGESLEFLAKICRAQVGEVCRAMNTLVLLNLVDVCGPHDERRYSIHSLTRTFLHEEIAKW